MSVSGSSQPLASVVPAQDLIREVRAYSRVTVEDLLREIGEQSKRYQALELGHPQRMVILTATSLMLRATFWKRALSNLPTDLRQQDIHAVPIYSEDGRMTVDAMEVRGTPRLSTLTEQITARLMAIRKESPQIFIDHLIPDVLRGWIQEANDLAWRDHRLGSH